jgi:hypothetical protein
MPLTLLLNPRVLLIAGLVVAFIANGFYWNHRGRAAERRAWQVEQAALDKLAGEALLAEKGKVIAKERELAAYKHVVETESAERERKIAGLRIANGRLVSAAGGLWDKNGRPRAQGGDAGAGEGAGAVSGGDAAGVGCALSQQVTDDLLDLARDADLDRSTALACQADLAGTTAILNQLVKDRAP